MYRDEHFLEALSEIYLTKVQAGKYLNMTKRQIEWMLIRGVLKSEIVYGRERVTVASLDQYKHIGFLIDILNGNFR